MPPVAGLALDLGMNGVATGGGTYPDDTCKRRQRGEKCSQKRYLPPCLSSPGNQQGPSLTRALKGSFLVISSSNEDKESISRSILLTFSLD